MTDPTRDAPGAALDPPVALPVVVPVDEDRTAILARRARFVASAMAGLVLGGSCEASSPQVCLNIAVPAGTDAGSPPFDAGGSAPDQGDAGPASSTIPALPDPMPGPCLRVAAPPTGSATSPAPVPSASGTATKPIPPVEQPVPAPCLKVAPPRR